MPPNPRFTSREDFFQSYGIIADPHCGVCQELRARGHLSDDLACVVCGRDYNYHSLAHPHYGNALNSQRPQCSGFIRKTDVALIIADLSTIETSLRG